jgi:Type II CAAX prenyl endopeptidase Rce1-like
MTSAPTSTIFSLPTALSGETGTAHAGGRRRALAELVAGYGLILVVIWTPRPWQRWFYIAALLWVLAATCLSFEGWKTMGLRAGGMLRSLWVVGAALAVAGLAVLAAERLGTLNMPHGASLFIRTFWGYAIWSFLQQFLLQDFVLLRLLRLLPSKRAAAVSAAGLFALAHLPNPVLTTVTVAWGVAACWLFLKYRNVFTLGMAHAILGVCVAIVVPGRMDHNMRVGLGYLRYHPRAMNYGEPGQRSPSDRSTPADVWLMTDDPMRHP